VGRACSYDKCKIKLHKQRQSQHINGQDHWETSSMDGDVIRTADRKIMRLDEMEQIHPKWSIFIRSAGDSSGSALRSTKRRNLFINSRAPQQVPYAMHSLVT